MTTEQVARVLRELGQLWEERDTLAELGGLLPTLVTSLHFGLMGGEPVSFVRMEELLDVPRERLREVENEVLQRLAAAGTVGATRYDVAP